MKMNYKECMDYLYEKFKNDSESLKVIDRLDDIFDMQKVMYQDIIDKKDYLLKNKEDWRTRIEVYDKEMKKKHVVGTDVHDCLLVTDGKVEYYNLQNGCGTPYTYEFVQKGLYDDEVQE